MNVFVYATLTNPEQVTQVVESYAFVGSAVLEGLHPVDGRYPTLAPGGRVGGRVLRTDDIDALDAYEGVDRGLYVRVAVPWLDAPDGGDDAHAGGDDRSAEDGDTVAVYVGDPERLDVTDDVSWPTGGSFRQQVERYLDAERIGVRRVD